MQNKLRQLIVSALKRNEFTAMLPLHVSLRGHNVVISGGVPSEDLLLEVVATVESVSPSLRVYSRMQVVHPAPVAVR